MTVASTPTTVSEVTPDSAAPSTGDSTEVAAADVTTTEPDVSTAGDESALGDAGKKALDAMKAARNEAKAEAKRLSDELAALKAQVEGRDAEHAAAMEAQRVKDEALARANERILKANLKAAAAGKLNDPADALTFIDVSEFDVDDDGSTDEAALVVAVEELIKSKPYLAAQGKRFQGSADGGARKDADGPQQLTRADAARMTADQITEALAKGQFNDLVGGK